ncbi:MAG: DUF882 domain-containing protein [Phyllobacterium sp.]
MKRIAWCGLLLAFSAVALAPSQAAAETRTLKLYFIHTKERAEITYKKNGRYIQSGLNQINRFLRDWRRNEPTKMDPRLLDLVWQVYQDTNARDYIHVVSAYRSPATNSMLRGRSRSSGVAKKSTHMLGKAMDFYIPGVRLALLRSTALKYQGGGVGYYPRSGSPFVHLDVGNVRHWPRMSRKELLAVFPKGNTIHVPSDGKPLPGYQQALAAYESRKSRGGDIAIASASPTKRSSKTLLGALFGGGADEEEDNGESEVLMAAAKPSRPAAARPAAAVATPAAAPARPAPEAAPAPAAIAPALPDRDVPRPLEAPRPDLPVAAPQVPSAEAQAALAFAVPVPVRRPDFGAVVASVEPQQAPLAALAVLPATRPTSAVDAIRGAIEANSDVVPMAAEPAAADPVQTAIAALVPVPLDNPRRGQVPAIEPMAVAAVVPQARPGVAAAPTVAGLIPAADRTAPVAQEPVQQVAAVSPKSSPRRTLLDSASAGSANPAALVDTGVRTTEKGAKPQPSAAKHAAPVVVPVQAEIPTMALASSTVANAETSIVRKASVNKAMRTAPTEVYTAGFEQGLPSQNTNKFTGKAVTFLSIAKFESAD